MVVRERQGMQWLDASHSLHGAGLLDDRLAVTLMDCRTGRLLDANGGFFTLTGFTPGGVLQRILDPILASLEDDQLGFDSSTPTSELPLVQDKKSSDEGGLLRWVPLRPCRQYPRTMQLLGEIVSAQRDDCYAPFRCRFVDGTQNNSTHICQAAFIPLPALIQPPPAA